MKRRIIASFYREDGLAQQWRSRRMEAMLHLVGLPPRARIIDLGGTAAMWRLFDHDFRVTLVNPRLQYDLVEDWIDAVIADACDLSGLFADLAFDLVFSNSTIEHVGDAGRRVRFAAEVVRLAPAFWIQTPSSRFPLECHTGIPFYWQLPGWAKECLSRSRRRALPEWDEDIRGTTVLHERELRQLFPDATFYRESLFGFEKSYSVFKPHPSSGRSQQAPGEPADLILRWPEGGYPSNRTLKG